MEVLDQKVQDTPSPDIATKNEASKVCSIVKEDPVKVTKENGTIDNKKENHSVTEKDMPVKSNDGINTVDTVNSNKQTEAVSGKQNNNKAAETAGKKPSREEKHSRRKDERSVEQVMRALNSFESPQEKLDALIKKYAEINDENRKYLLQSKNFERRLSQVERERDTAQSEHSKAVLTRSRLEGLCRELQRQNKAIKEESLLRIREEEEKRKEVSNKFQTTLAEITSLMQQNNDKNSKLRDDNIEMTTKFKSVCEQYELRVQQVEKISKQMQLEAQLADAKLAKAHLEAKAEKEAMLRDKQELLMELAQYQARAKEQHATELELRGQVELYTNKYDEFQTALSRSNEVFGGFKEEMERMSKKIVKLEKETSTWKLRWEKSHQALLEMASDKQQRDAELSLANRQLTQLHKLCRTLTEERAKLMAQINAAGAPADATKEEKLAADIAEDRRKLNDTLDSLQSVILERELLQKQQQLEKQQQQLQLELQKHVAASAVTADAKTNGSKPSDIKASDSKTNEGKSCDLKTPGNKTQQEGNKKKGKKQKPGRQTSGKVEGSQDIKADISETKAENPEVPTSAAVDCMAAACLVENSALVGSPTKSEISADPPPATCLSTTAAEACPANKIDPKVDVSVPECTTSTTETSLDPKVDVSVPECTTSTTETSLEGKGMPVSSLVDTPAQSASVPLAPSPEGASAAPAFSYAAAVGSKPSEQVLKTEETPADQHVSENEIVAASASVDISNESPSPCGDATNGLTKPETCEILPLSGEEPSTVAPPSMSPTKKGKDTNKKKKHK